MLIGGVSATGMDNLTSDQDIDKVINQDSDEILTVEESSAGSDDSGLKELENKNILKTNNNDNLRNNVTVTGKTFSDIQEAINEAKPGDTITLDGLYTGSGTTININKTNLTLIGINDATLDAKKLSKIFSISDENVVLKNIKFMDGKSSNGGGVYWAGKNGVVINSTFINNSAIKEGGGIYWAGKNGVVINSTFINNSAVNEGGGIYWSDSGSVINSMFINNTVISDTQFIYAGYTGGGGISLYNGRVINSIFINNAADFYGGGIFCRGRYGLIESNTFINNKASAYGGGVYCYIGCNVRNSTFINNNASVSGGGVYCYIGCNVRNSTFINNTAHKGGGAFLYSDGTVLNSIFSNNFAWYGGAGILINNGATIKDSIFENNSASNYGGGISAVNSNLDNITVNNNSANVGGGAYLYGSTIKNSNFYNNIANNGSEIYYINTITLTNNKIEGNITSLNTTYGSDFQERGMNYIGSQQYWGFCLQAWGNNPESGFLDNSMQQLINKINKQSIFEHLKILTYISINSSKFNINVFADYVWTFSDGEYWNSDDPVIREVISLYDSGFRVPSVNAIKLLPNSTLMVFNFTSIITPTDSQNLFLFRYDYQNITNLSVDKKVLNKTIFVGNEFEYLITVSNSGNQTLDDVYVVDDDYTSNIQFVRFVNGTGNWIYSNESITVTDANSNYKNISSRWILTSPLKPGENKTIVLIFKALNNGTVVNNVTSGFKQIELSNGTDGTVIYSPNMAVKKITLTPVVMEGSLTTFMILVSNTGDYDLNDVFVVESNYSGLVYDSYKGVNWTKSGDKFKYNGVLHVGESIGFNITFKTVNEGNFTNIVVAGSNETDNKTTNNTTEVLKPGLEVHKITLNKKVLVGDKVTFEILVKNTGHVDLTGVFIEETDYSGLVYDSYKGVNWTKSGDKFKYNGVLHVGESIGFNITFKTVNEGNFTNIVVAGSNETDNKTTNNTTEVIKKPTLEDNHTSENKTTIVNKTYLVNKKTSANKTTEKDNITISKIKNSNNKIIFDKKATGNPLLLLLLALVIIPIRRFKK